ncbi:mitochondrial 54S ribosomal protein uL5m MRPL7 [Sporobolomyces salmoneus]|uniref:mitochondrial 54S ribosomal protein uL5m MRPL7 n=1 Tax=Sporobolomyces salmoneus TaxID=183962 RepID=UPI003178958A
MDKMKAAVNLTRTATRAAVHSPSPIVSLRHASSSSSSSSSESPSSTTTEHLTNLTYGDTARSRIQDHYTQSLSHDLLYLFYNHQLHSSSSSLPNPISRTPIWSPQNPYAENRAPPRPKGNRYLVPNPSYVSPSTLPRLESIVVESMSKTALQGKSNLLPLLMAFEATTGEPPQSKHPGPYGPGSHQGLEITRSTKKSASFKIRAGAPTGVKVELKGQPMYTFLETLVDFVLPRLKTFQGIPLPPASSPRQSTSSTSGVVSFGLPPEAMGLWPQIEINLDQYPKTFGMNIFCKTTAKGRGAQDQARALLSGAGLPFEKR